MRAVRGVLSAALSRSYGMLLEGCSQRHDRVPTACLPSLHLGCDEPGQHHEDGGDGGGDGGVDDKGVEAA